MFNFHKPRVYRSADGCCICRAKSSSSRFTASRKYEKESMQCFNLHEPRNGEICNACVLLVKRYKRLPVGSKRHWGHVVDARAGPGTKSLAKQKKRENECDGKTGGGGSFIPEKFAKIFKKNRKGKITAAASVAPSVASQQQLQQRNGSSHESSPHSEEQPSDSNESHDEQEQQLQHQQQQQPQQQQPHQLIACVAATPYQTRKRTAAAAQLATATVLKKSVAQRLRLTGSKRRRMLEPKKHRRAVDNVPFFEEHDLLRLDVCCGTVFQSLSLGSACYIIDPELYKPCEKHRRRRQQQQQSQPQPPRELVQPVQAAELEPKAISQSISTPALKKHHLYFKRQSESFPQGEIHRISPVPLNKTEAMPNPTPATAATTTNTLQQQQHSTANGSLALALKPTLATAAASVTSSALHASILTTAVGAASPSSLSSSSNCSTSSSVATKFNDNSSDSGFDEHVLERKSVSPPTQDELQLEKKAARGGGSVQRLILASGLPISGQAQNLVLTGNEFTARFVQRQQAPTQALKINVLAAGAAAAAVGGGAAAGGAAVGGGGAAGAAAATTTGSQSSGNKMRAIFNNANTIQHENGVTTILPASSLAASNQTAAMNAIAPSTVTITPAKKSTINPTPTAASTAAAVNPKFILLKPAIASKFGSSSSNNGANPALAELKIA
ncbi:coiled-coil domain-containing protein CG32809 [Drosophila montana]|uniref:coiled-coil domain-containing protein CG32809 n=1 Tax=Drosophila montana TaxID=40370 RepID=UPI00313C8B3B